MGKRSIKSERSSTKKRKPAQVSAPEKSEEAPSNEASGVVTFLTRQLELSKADVEVCQLILKGKFDEIGGVEQDKLDRLCSNAIESGLMDEENQKFYAWLVTHKLSYSISALLQRSLVCPALKGLKFFAEAIELHEDEYFLAVVMPAIINPLASSGSFLIKANLDGVNSEALTSLIEKLLMSTAAPSLILEALRGLLRSYEMKIAEASRGLDLLEKINVLVSEQTAISQVLNM
eukprot:Blabericola_migrator_1__5791@NODE_2934_length_2191_cov_137_740113_g1840_i0_p4_GENE_NODE_2934_length_2191_cov_137_740113_g1840_i0NODE_2934_length_2191_cov_137_740113_g1840_i0_p4_ORF_typecomplete_len233_score42_49_NODE_2934_length_2191_cov_137_740113_g1840_i08221520